MGLLHPRQCAGLARRSLSCFLPKADPEGPALISYAVLQHGFHFTFYSFRASAAHMLVPASLPQKAACYGIGIPTVAELACVNNHFPLIFFASPSRFMWLFAVQKGRPVAGFKETSK